MNKFGLIGRKITYTYSKKLHQEIGKHFGLKFTYDILDLESEFDVINALELIRQKDYSGFNITIPYKEFIIRYCDILTPEAKAIGAVNTVYLSDGKIVGDNTDYYGFLKLLNLYHINPKNKVSYILGSGGAAKAVSFALKTLGAKAIVVSRDKDKTKKSFDFVTDYKTLDLVENIDIMINTTPIGTFPNTGLMPVEKHIAQKTAIAIDLIYNPNETRLMKEASFGIGGIYMLIGQAIKAQSIWQKKTLDESKETFDILMEAIL